MFNYACLFHVRQLHKSRSHKYICQNVKQFPTHVANVILHPPGVMSVQREGRGLNVLGRCSREPLLTCFTRNITLTHFLKGSRWTWKHDGSGEMYSDSYVDLIEPPSYHQLIFRMRGKRPFYFWAEDKNWIMFSIIEPVSNRLGVVVEVELEVFICDNCRSNYVSFRPSFSLFLCPRSCHELNWTCVSANWANFESSSWC